MENSENKAQARYQGHGCKTNEKENYFLSSLRISPISILSSFNSSLLSLRNKVTASSHAEFIGSSSNFRPAMALNITNFLDVTVALVRVFAFESDDMSISLTSVSHFMFKYFGLLVYKHCVNVNINYIRITQKHKLYMELHQHSFTHKHKNTIKGTIMVRINTYINKKNQEIVEQGQKLGIKPSHAMIAGYKSLMGKSATYHVLEQQRDILLKQLHDIETQLEKLKQEINIDPEKEDEVIKDLVRCYLRDKVIPETTLEVRRVELNLTLEEMKELVTEKVIKPCNEGIIDSVTFNLREVNEIDADKAWDDAIRFFKQQYGYTGALNEKDIKLWTHALNVNYAKLKEILEGEIIEG